MPSDSNGRQQKRIRDDRKASNLVFMTVLLHVLCDGNQTEVFATGLHSCKLQQEYTSNVMPQGYEFLV